MAEAILFSAVQSLLKNLGSIALDEMSSTWRFKTDLVKLNNTMNTIKDVMLDAEERQVDSHAVRGWLHRLKPVVYAADDLFDEFATRASQREVRDFFSRSNPAVFAFNVSRKIKNIRKELDEIVEDGSKFAFVVRPYKEEASSHSRMRDQTHSFVNVNEVVGRDNDRKAIIDILMASCAANEQPQSIISVVPIVGIGGMGKTTLAQLIYNDEQIMEQFDIKLWVCVSEVFDIKEIVKKILMSATNKESPNLEMDQLQGQLRREIGEKKYLLVLDDVWNEKPEEWRALSSILNVGKVGSKIVVTTRSNKVADIMGTVPIYVLGGLSKEKSLALFEKMAFEDGESQKNPHLLKLGEEIVRKCGGVPLALRALGTLLHGSEEWKWISIAGTSFEKLPDAQDNIIGILKLSYNHLFSPLKNCFAYCSLFPKDYLFTKESLVDLWMAEGFVVPSYETQSLKALGNEYLMILLQRCFFQDVTWDDFGSISSFKMHDLMHNLALDVSGSDSKMAKFQETNFNDRILHMSFNYHLRDSWGIPNDMLKAKQLRTFLLVEKFRDGSNFNTKVLQQLISNFECLRVLDLSDLRIITLPKSIGKLIHLRYLNLSVNPIKELPNSITKLQNLQTLILKSCKSLIELPIHTRKLSNLRTLDLLGCYQLTHMPPGLGELTSLHKLPYFVIMENPANAQLRDLKNLNNLSGSLEIELNGELEVSQANEADLISKHGLTELYIHNKYSRQDETLLEGLIRNDGTHDEALLEGLKPHQNLKKLRIRGYKGGKLPSWAMGDSLCMTLPNLVDIDLSLLDNCEDVPCFSQLPFLKCLSLHLLNKVEYMEKSPLRDVESTTTFFPSLQQLGLRYMYNLKGWWEEAMVVNCSDEEKLSEPSTQHHPLSPSFSGLIKLEICDCPGLVSFPTCPNVEELMLMEVNKELTVLKNVTNSGGSSDVGSSKLKKLDIDDVGFLISMSVECLGQLTSLMIMDSELKNTSEVEKVFKHLSSLTSLVFSVCGKLTSISVGIEHLVSLETLRLAHCKELIMKGIEEGMPWKSLKTLRRLDLWSLDKLEHLPSGFQHLTNLHHLYLYNLPNLEELPEWIGCLSSLQSMEISKCPKLRRLPEEMRKLSSLKELNIRGCSGLTKRCRGPNGADWPYICHIPLLAVYDN